LIKIGKIKIGGRVKLYIVKDNIHSDYIFESILFKDIFKTKKRFIKIGWGDRKMFLETKTWNDLKIKDFLFAFFGLNESVIKVEFLETIPKNIKTIKINEEQLDLIKIHIIESFENKLIKKKPGCVENGDFYKSNLQYNCITNCNNWINQGLIKAKVSNRLWCPLSLYL
jgi:uncharacterized protein (TIGR02117 family)